MRRLTRVCVPELVGSVGLGLVLVIFLGLGLRFRVSVSISGDSITSLVYRRCCGGIYCLKSIVRANYRAGLHLQPVSCRSLRHHSAGH